MVNWLVETLRGSPELAIFLALGAGFILALVFLELIPASLRALGEEASLWMMVGFASIHFFEHTVATASHASMPSGVRDSHSRAFSARMRHSSRPP